MTKRGSVRQEGEQRTKQNKDKGECKTEKTRKANKKKKKKKKKKGKKKENKRTREQDLQIEKKTQITDAYTTYK